MAVNVTRLFHIEIVVPDAEASYGFLNRVFGPGAEGTLPVYMMDAMDKVGFRIEMAEMP